MRNIAMNKLTPVIILATVTWSLTMVKSGLPGKWGLGFWGPNGHDGIWHIAIARSFIRDSWEMPVFAGETIKNYHVGFDLLLAIIHKITFIPVENLYFQIIPLLLSIGIGISCFAFVKKWRRSDTQALWATFFVYFGGSFGWLVNYLRNQNVDGESMFWSQQSVSTLVNPPFALSIFVIFISLNLLLQVFEKDNKQETENRKRSIIHNLFNSLINFYKSRKINQRKTILLIFLLGSLVQIKVYAGVLVLAGLLFASLYRIFVDSDLKLFKIFIGASFLSAILFFPITDLTKTTLVFKPFWFLETMMVLSDRVNWPRYFQAMTTYRYADDYIKAFTAYGIAFLIFIVGNFGTRVLAILNLFTKESKDNYYRYIDVSVIVLIVFGVLIPTFFVQSATAWNTIQFMYYSLIFSGVYAGIWLGGFLEKSTKRNRMYGYFVSGLVILTTLPTTFATLYHHYLPQRPPAVLTQDEYDALRFLAKQSDGVVLTCPYDAKAAKEAESTPPRPLYLYESTAYVSAYSGKNVFLEDEVNLDITGYDWRERKEQILEFYTSLDHQFVYDFLRENNISYVYWVDDQRATLGEAQLGLTEIFRNKSVVIYRTD